MPGLDEISPSGTAFFSTLRADASFVGSQEPAVGLDGLFPLRTGPECRIAVLPNGEDSFAQRMRALAAAKRSIRIQALIFTGDEAGLAIMDILKKKHAEGLDVRVIVITNSPGTNDLPYCRPITLEAAEAFENPSEALYKLQKSFGDLFEEHL